MVDSQKPVNITHSGSCDPPYVGICTLPVDANITLTPLYSGAVGSGVLVNAKISIDLYASRSSQNSEYTPAIQADDDTTTVLRVIFPNGFSLCQDVVNIQGNSVGLPAESWPSGMTLGPIPATSFRQIQPIQRGSGIREPLPGQLVPNTNVPVRTGTISGPFDPDPLSRAFEIEFVHGTITTSIPNITQRLTFTISNILTSQTVGPIPSPVNSAGVNVLPTNTGIQIFGIQIFKVVSQGGGAFSYTMTYYNNRINDMRLDPTRWTWFKSTFVGSAILSINQICPDCMSVILQSSSMSELTTLNFTFINVSPIPVGGAVSLEVPGFDLGAVPLDNVYISAQVSNTNGNNLWGLLSNVSKSSNSITVRREIQTGTQCQNDAGACSIYANSIIALVIPQVRTPSAYQVLSNGSFYGRISTLSAGIGGQFEIDAGLFSFAPFTPSILRNITISLDSYLAGEFPINITISMLTTQQIPANGVISIHVPIGDFLLSQQVKIYNANFTTKNTSFSIEGSDMLEGVFTIVVRNQIKAGAFLRVSLGPVRNRQFSGQISRPISFETKADGLVLDVGSSKLNESLKAATFRSIQCFCIPMLTPGKVSEIVIDFVLENQLPRNGSIAINFPQFFSETAMSRVKYSWLTEQNGTADPRWAQFLHDTESQISVLIDLGQLLSPGLDSIPADSRIVLTITDISAPNFVSTGNILEVTTYYNFSENISFSVDHGTCSSLAMSPGDAPINSIEFDPGTSGSFGSVALNFSLANSFYTDSQLVLQFPNQNFGINQAVIDDLDEFEGTVLENATLPGALWKNNTPSIYYNQTSGEWVGTYTTENDIVYKAKYTSNLHGITGAVLLSVISDTIHFKRVNRTLEAVWYAARFRFFQCTAPDPEECLVPCQASPAGNCSFTVSSNMWAANSTEAPNIVAANTLVHIRLSNILFPDYAGFPGYFRLTSRDGSGRTVDESLNTSSPDVLPGLLNNVSLTLSNNEVARTGTAKIVFITTNAINGPFSIFVSLPDGFVCAGNLSFSVAADCSWDSAIYQCSDRNFTLTGTPEMGLNIDVNQAYTICMGVVHNRPYAAGPSGVFLVQTQTRLSSSEVRAVDSFAAQGPNLTQSYLYDSEINVTSDGGSVLLAGNRINVSVRFRSFQKILLTQYARILVYLDGTGVTVPEDPMSISVAFSCQNVFDLAGFCPKHLNSTRKSGCSKCYFPESSVSFDGIALIIEYYEWSILPERQIYSPVDVPPGYLVEFELYNLYAYRSAGPSTESHIEIQALAPDASHLQIFDSSTPITFPAVVPCGIINATVDVNSGFGIELNFQLCQTLYNSSTVEIHFPLFSDCNNVSCDAYNRISGYFVPPGKVLTVNSSVPQALVWKSKSITNNVLELQSVGELQSRTSISVTLSGLNLPIVNDWFEDVILISIVGSSSQELEAFGNATIASDLLNKTEFFFTSFLGKANVLGSAGAIGFSFVLNAPYGQSVKGFTLLFPLQFNVTSVAVSDFRINGLSTSLKMSLKLTKLATFSNLTLTLVGTDLLDFGTWVQFSLINIVNPNSTGSYQLLDFQFLGASNKVLYHAVRDSLILTLQPGSLTRVVVGSTSLFAGSQTNVSLSFSTANPVDLNGQLQIDATGIISNPPRSISTYPSQALMYLQCNSPESQVRFCFKFLSKFSSDSEIMINLHGLHNVPYSSQQTWLITTIAPGNSLIDLSASEDGEVWLYPGVAFGSITAGSLRAGSVGNLIISFSTSNPISSPGVLSVLLPAGFTYTTDTTIMNITGQNTDYQSMASISANEGPITIRFVPMCNGTLICSTEAVGAGKTLSITLGPSIQLPKEIGVSQSALIQSKTEFEGVEYVIDCVGAECPASPTAGAYQELAVTIVPNVLVSVNLVPASVATRAGLSQDTRGNNPALLSFRTTNPIPPNGSIAIFFSQGFFSLFSSPDPGATSCQSQIYGSSSIFNCISSISCTSGCSESFTIKNVPFQLPGGPNFQLVAFQSVLNRGIAAGTTLSLLIQTFAIPAGATTANFTVCTGTQSKVAIDCGSTPLLNFQAASFQRISMLDPQGLVYPGPQSCYLSQPSLNYSNTGTNQSFFINTLVMKITNKVPFNGSINIDVPRSSLTITKFVGTLLPANITICSPRNISTAAKNTTNSSNTTYICGKSTLIGVSFVDSLPASRRFSLRVTAMVPEDSIINITSLGRVNGTGDGVLRNRYWSGPVDQYNISTSTATGSLLDQQSFSPFLCSGGTLFQLMITEIVSQLASSSVCLSNVVAGGTGFALFPLQFPFSIPSNATAIIRIYLPPDFKIQNIQNTSINTSNVTVGITRSYLSQGLPYWTGNYSLNRTILNLEFRTFSGMTSIALGIRNLVNAPYAYGYPSIASNYENQVLVLQFLVSTSQAQSSFSGQLPMFRFEFMVVLAPFMLSNVRVVFANTAVAQSGSVNITFRAPMALPISSQFIIRMPTLQGINVSSYGFAFNVSNDPQGSCAISWGPNYTFALTSSVDNSVVPSDIVSPLSCPSNASFCSRSYNCSSCSPCNPMGTNSSSFASSQLTLQSNYRAVRFAYFYVPVVSGHVCNLTEPVQAQPLDWLVPSSCNISGDYTNTTVLLRYFAPEEMVPPGTDVTLIINNVRNPLQYANCTGWFDLQIKQQFDLGWMMLARALSACQVSPSAGSLNMLANFSTLKTGACCCTPYYPSV